MRKEIGYVLIEGEKSVMPIEFLEERIHELLEENLGTEIKVYPAIENVLSLDAEYIVESLSDDDLICQDTYVPQENIDELQDLLDKWCLKTQKSVSMTYAVDRRKEINVVEMVYKIKRDIRWNLK